MYDIFFVGKSNDEFQKLKIKFPLAKQVNTFADAKHKSLTKMFWVVWDDVKITSDFNFGYKIPEWDKQYVHVFKNGDHNDNRPENCETVCTKHHRIISIANKHYKKKSSKTTA